MTTSEKDARNRRAWGLKFAIALTIALVANALLYVREAITGNAARLATLKSLESRYANPVLVTLAGARPWGIARLAHVGRESGRRYLTPLWAMPASGGFVIAMPFGQDADWTRNLLHAGEATMRYQDIDYLVGHPRIVARSDASAELPASMRLLTDLLGIRNILRVDVLSSAGGEAVAPA